MIPGPVQPILGLFQRCFGSSCIHQVYFLRKSTEFHDILTDCQRINKSRSFINVLLMYHKFPLKYWPLSPRSLPDHSLVWWRCYVELIPYVRGCKLEPSFKDISHDPVTSSVNEASKTFLTEDPEVWSCIPNPQKILPHMWIPWIPPCPHTTPQIQNNPT